MKTHNNSGDFTESRIRISSPAYKIFVVFDRATFQRKCIRNLPVFSKEGYGALFRMFSVAL
jgi:hypothetical protein